MTYSIIDVETTGLSARGGDRILEIGVAQLREDGSVEASLDTLVNPGRPVAASHVHGISDAMVSEAPRFRDILPLLEDVLDGTVISAHNASFDLGFLREEYHRSGVKLPYIKPVCTLILARKLLPTLPSKSLETCRKHLGITDDGAHNALADAMATAQLLRYFIEKYGENFDTTTYQRISAAEPTLSLFDEEPRLKPRSGAGETT